MNNNERQIILKTREKLEKAVTAYEARVSDVDFSTLYYILGLLDAILEQKDEVTIVTPWPGVVHPVYTGCTKCKCATEPFVGDCLCSCHPQINSTISTNI